MSDANSVAGNILVLGTSSVACAIERLLADAGFARVEGHPDLVPAVPAGADLVVCVLTTDSDPEVARSVEQACLDASVPCLFVAPQGDELAVGPLVRRALARRGGGCSTCLEQAPWSGSTGDATSDDTTSDRALAYTGQLAAAVVLREAHRLLVLGQVGELVAKRTLIDLQGRSRLERLAYRPGCSRCGAPASVELHRLADLHRAAERFLQPPRRRVMDPGSATATPGERAVRRVGILGGGSAGYLAALVLRRKLPSVEVTVIASSDIPVIGVGEASTPLLPALLHGTLGLDLPDFFRRAQPTLKLGIHFDWGSQVGAGFHYPFDRGPLLESLQYEGHINAYCPSALLMTAGRAPLLRLGDGSMRWLGAPFAYHVDNRRFVRYLQEEAERAGVTTLDRHVERAEVGQLAGGEKMVEALHTDRGERLEADLWIDASGFGSVLLGEALDVPFVDFAPSLFTNAALAAPHPRRHDRRSTADELPPYTTAATWNHGWSWRIPQPEEDHVGYVFSTAHATPEQAEVEFRKAYPGAADPRLLHFRPGRRREAWVGNVVALGNAYGFVEPLESTSLHMIALTTVLLVQHFPHGSTKARDEPTARRSFNRYIGDFWDELRWFLALHFKFNQRRDSEFWRACRADVDVSGAQVTLGLFRERAPLSYRPHLEDYDPLWGDFGRDVLLMGQGVAGGWVEPRLSAEQWGRTMEHGRALVAAALPHGEVLELLRERPEIGWQLQAGASWLSDAAVGGRVRW